MQTSEPKKQPGIFLSYRRSDNPDATGRIYDRLVAEFGKSRVFKDVDSIPLGQDFRGHLNEVVGGCAAVLAIIGPHWTDARNASGQRRLEDPDDFVRIELEAALARSIPVVPVLVAHAPMSTVEQLPASLASLVYRQAIEVRPDPDFHNDATRLVAALRQILDPNAPVVTAKPQRPLKWMVAFVAAALAAAALAVPALKHLRAVPPPETRTEIVTPPTELPGEFALSPDGRQIVLTLVRDGKSQLWLRSLGRTSAQPLPGTEDAFSVFWSPDSRSIGFYSPGGFKRLDLGGGQPKVLGPGGIVGAATGTWNSDGVILVSGISGPIERVAATGGPITMVLGPGEALGQALWAAQFLPDGRGFVFNSIQGSADGIYLGSLDGRKPVRLTTDNSRVAFLPPAWMVWVSAGALVAQQLDVRKAALTGAPVTLADATTDFSTSATGLVAYRSSPPVSHQLTWVDRSGKTLGTVGDPDESLSAPRIAPDGRRVAVTRTTGAKQDVWLLDGGRSSRMTFGEYGSRFPVWSPNGLSISFSSRRSAEEEVLRQRLASGAGAEEMLVTPSGQNQFALAWSTDGRYLLFSAGTVETAGDLWVLPMTGDRKAFALLATRFNESRGLFSPDGRWVAYQSDESGYREVYVRPFVLPDPAQVDAGSSAGSARWQVSTAGGADPVWRADGKEIFFISPAGDMMAAPIAVNGLAVEPGAPVRLFAAGAFGGGVTTGLGRQYDVTRDGRFLINRVVRAGGDLPITLIQNWNPQARR